MPSASRMLRPKIGYESIIGKMKREKKNNKKNINSTNKIKVKK